MKILKKLKSNRGSALSMVLVLLVLMSYLSILIMNLAYTNFKMGESYIAENKMFNGVDTALTIIASNLENEIAYVQEETKEEVEYFLQDGDFLLEEFPEMLNEKGTLSQENYDFLYNKLYSEMFWENLEVYSDVGKGYYENNYRARIMSGEIEPITGKVLLKDVPIGGNKKVDIEFLSGGYNLTERQIKIVLDADFFYTVEGESGNSKKRRVEVVFDVLDSPESFNLLNYKVVNNKNINTNPILSNQTALIAEKNIIFAGGNGADINIDGDVLAFGRIPTTSAGDENQSANWIEYGGVFFGYSKKINGSLNANREEVFGDNWNKDKVIPDSTDVLAGNITINGDVGTMSYVNIAKNNNHTVQINGDTFARQFLLSEDSHQSEVVLGYEKVTDLDPEQPFDLRGNLYTTDDLQVDSTNSKLTVRGSFYGISDTYVNVGGLNDTLDWTNPKRTSTVNINGNSIVELRKGVYIGGTSFLRNITNNGNAYLTGISATKSSQISSQAYIYSSSNNKVYTNQNGNSYEDAKVEQYKLNGVTNISMINGYGVKTGADFVINDRATHFKGYFKNKVANKFGLLGTMNFGNLRVALQDNKIEGWAQGAIVAAGIGDFDNIIGTQEINAFYTNEFTEDAADFTNKQSAWIQKYQSKLKAFLNDYGSAGNKIIQTQPDIRISDYISKSDSIFNMIGQSVEMGDSIIYNSGFCNGFVFADSGEDKEIFKNDNGEVRIRDYGTTKKGKLLWSDPEEARGIIYVGADIYIKDDIDFEGLIISTGNITITAKNVNITRNRNYKVNGQYNDIVTELIEKDFYARIFFGLEEYDIDMQSVAVQRVNQESLKIKSWKLY